MQPRVDKERIYLLDIWRGLAVILMVIYHTLYDLKYIFLYPISIFGSAGFEAVRLFIASSFIILAGISCNFSKSNIRRGVRTFGFAMLLTIVTLVIMPNQRILFGVLHFLGSAMILYHFIAKWFCKVPPLWGCTISLLLFFATYHTSYGFWGIGPVQITLPSILSKVGFLFPLGFYPPGFWSADYYPLLPWFFLFLFGTYIGRYFQAQGWPKWAARIRLRPLEWVGSHAIVIYMLHQPLIYGLLRLLLA